MSVMSDCVWCGYPRLRTDGEHASWCGAELTLPVPPPPPQRQVPECGHLGCSDPGVVEGFCFAHNQDRPGFKRRTTDSPVWGNQNGRGTRDLFLRAKTNRQRQVLRSTMAEEGVRVPSGFELGEADPTPDITGTITREQFRRLRGY